MSSPFTVRHLNEIIVLCMMTRNMIDVFSNIFQHYESITSCFCVFQESPNLYNHPNETGQINTQNPRL